MKILEKSISQLIDLMEDGQVRSEQVINIYLENIEKKGLDKKVYKSFMGDQALGQAREIDERRKRGEKLGRLAGIPLALTEDISRKGFLTEAGSKILQDYIAPYNASLVEKLEEEDAIILGNIKIGEFDLETSDYGARTILEGGALGLIGSTSTALGLVGLKASYGLISRYGVISASSSLSPLSILSRKAEDLDLILASIEGYDGRDSTSMNLGNPPARPKKKVKEDFKLKIPTDLMKNGQVEELMKNLEEIDFIIEESEIKTQEYILPAYKILSSAEFASTTGRYDGIRYGFRAKDYENREELYKNTRSQGFGKEAKKAIIFGNHVINSGQYNKYYKQGQKLRTLIKEEVDRIVEDGSILFLPLGEDLGEDLKKTYRELASMTGYPMISLAYKNQKGQYMDLCLLSQAFDEGNLIRLGHILQEKLRINGGGR